MKYSLFFIVFFFILHCGVPSLFAHEIHLKNGRIIKTGNVWREGDTVHYEQYGGTISIPFSRVKGVVYDEKQQEESNTSDDQVAGEQERPLPSDKDLAAKLKKSLAPKNSVEQASLCTLSVKTAVGFGSGFFISDDGFIVTNKHVVRGSEKQAEEIDQQIDQTRRRFVNHKKYLDNIAQRNSEYRADAKKQRSVLNRLEKTGRYEKQYLTEKRKELREFEKELRREEKEYKKAKKKYLAQKREFEKDVGKFRSGQRELAGQGTFKIILADETELYATLYRVSDEHDLALLKITGYRTPFLQPVRRKNLSQGQKVFAVGSPADLSLQNTVTSGVLSAIRKNFVQTNAQIYPGNSGGPLIDEQGRVIGVNTKKLLTRKFEGLGFAIPISIVFSEFRDYLLDD
ncbi:MAG: trypsin-like peptidase domain-containing protein [Candidatus Electrothrix sp. YB6]